MFPSERSAKYLARRCDGSQGVLSKLWGGGRYNTSFAVSVWTLLPLLLTLWLGTFSTPCNICKCGSLPCSILPLIQHGGWVCVVGQVYAFMQSNEAKARHKTECHVCEHPLAFHVNVEVNQQLVIDFGDNLKSFQVQRIVSHLHPSVGCLFLLCSEWILK